MIKKTLWFCLLFYSCALLKPKQKTISQQTLLKNRFMNALDSVRFQGKFLKVVGKIRFEDAQGKKQAHYRLFWIKDEKLWMSLSLFGIEGLRIQWTPEKLQVLNRLNRTYYEIDYRQWMRRYGIPLSFSEILYLFVGDLPKEWVEQSEISQQGGKWLLRFMVQDYKAQVVVHPTFYKVQSAVIEGKDFKSIWTVKEFQKAQMDYLPRIIEGKLRGKYDATFSLHHQRFSLLETPPALRFTIPKGYAVVKY